MRMRWLLLVLMLLVAACGDSESIVEPGPAEVDSEQDVDQDDEDDEDDETGNDGGDVVTEDSTESTTTSTLPPTDDDDTGEDDASDGVGDADGDADEAATIDDDPAADFVLDEDSENAATFTELAGSGLVLTLDEQECTDQTVADSLAGGAEELDAIISGITTCASPAAVDDFASNLLVAGGNALPATEAACVSSRLRSGEQYRPFWAALLAEEPFDFLLADLDAQNNYLDFYSECVSVGRALREQSGADLSTPTIGCIDALYQDREFVRGTIEADLSGDPAEQERIASQISTCLTSDEQQQLGLN